MGNYTSRLQQLRSQYAGGSLTMHSASGQHENVLLSLTRSQAAMVSPSSMNLGLAFLELFAAAPTDWLRFAFVHAAPFIAEQSGHSQVKELAEQMFARRVMIDECRDLPVG